MSNEEGVESKKVSERSKKTLERLDTGTYRNTRQINIGGIAFSAREVLVKAPLVSGLNCYILGGTGEGKTQLANDLVGYFGDRSCYAMGRPDFEPSELMKQVRLDKLRGARSDSDLVELTQNVDANLFYVDELNRCPPIVQNYFFDFFDGKLVHQGKIMPLGRKGYSVGFATGNLGYIGVSDSDRALKDRMHMIVKLDHPDFEPTHEDDYNIFSAKKNPRASMPISGQGFADDIIELNREFNEREITPMIEFLGIYFTKGLDYLENTGGHSKKVLNGRWPNVPGVNHDNNEGRIFPLSRRAVFSAMALGNSLEMIAWANGHELREEDSLKIFLDSLRLTVPYSGVISEKYIDVDHSGDVYGAYDEIMEEIKADVLAKGKHLEYATLLSGIGKKHTRVLEGLSGFKWAPVRRAIEAHADYKKDNLTEDDLKVKDQLEMERRK